MDFVWLKNEWAYFTGALVTLIFIVDPFATVPVFLALTERFSALDRRQIAFKASLYALILLVVFAISGMKFFELFGITLPAFQIAGGILLLSVGMSQLNAKRQRVSHEEEDEGLHRDNVTIFPLTTPLLAGPGAISTVILFSTEAGSVLRLAELTLAIGSCMVVVFVILHSSRFLHRVLGHTGLNLLSRIMGIVLTAVAVQFILNGVKSLIEAKGI